MNCTKTQKLLSAYLDSELGAEDLRQVQAHVASCAACAARLTEYQRLEAGFVAGRKSPPADFSAQVMMRIARDEMAGRHKAAEMISVWDWLFRPAVRVSFAMGAAAVFLLAAFFVMRELQHTIDTQNTPKAVPFPLAWQPHFSVQPSPAAQAEVANSSITNKIFSQVTMTGNGLVVYAANPEAAVAVTRVVAENCGGRVLSVNRDANNSAVWRVQIQIPQQQTAEFRESLLDTQVSDDAALSRKADRLARVSEDAVSRQMRSNLGSPQQLVPSPLRVAQTVIGATDSNVSRAASDTNILPAASKMSQESLRPTVIEVEIRSGDLSK